MNLRFKILSGFIILAVMLGAAGIISILEFNQIGRSVRALLDDNYKSITAAKNMIEALERQDSGILILMSGDWENGRTMIQAADADFQNSLQVAGNNITITGEQDHIAAIREAYGRYKSLWERPIVDTQRQENLRWYYNEVHPVFLQTKTSVNELMTLNDKTMYLTASELKERAGRAIMPGLVAIAAALLFSLVFNFFINLYVVRPIRQLNTAIHAYTQKGEPFRMSVDTRDEIARLTETVRELIVFKEKDGKSE